MVGLVWDCMALCKVNLGADWKEVLVWFWVCRKSLYTLVDRFLHSFSSFLPPSWFYLFIECVVVWSVFKIILDSFLVNPTIWISFNEIFFYWLDSNFLSLSRICTHFIFSLCWLSYQCVLSVCFVFMLSLLLIDSLSFSSPFVSLLFSFFLVFFCSLPFFSTLYCDF